MYREKYFRIPPVKVFMLHCYTCSIAAFLLFQTSMVTWGHRPAIMISGCGHEGRGQLMAVPAVRNVNGNFMMVDKVELRKPNCRCLLLFTRIAIYLNTPSRGPTMVWPALTWPSVSRDHHHWFQLYMDTKIHTGPSMLVFPICVNLDRISEKCKNCR